MRSNATSAGRAGVGGEVSEAAGGWNLMPICRQNSGRARFHRSRSRLVTLARWSRLIST